MKRNRGFTLVEILIVVIILGILAAIVIPQFTNASQDARNSSVASTLQTVRSQIELYKIQHSDKSPTLAQITDWSQMMAQSDTTGNTTGTNFGPYLQAAPVNPLNGATTVAAAAATNVGWVYAGGGTAQYSIYPVDTTGTGTFNP
jgi:general secretion pathway protein G